MAQRSKSVYPRSTGPKVDRTRPAVADAAQQGRAGSTAGWSDEDSGLWGDEGPVFDSAPDIIDMTARPGVTPGARRRLEQYWEDRRLQDALKDAFDE